MGAEHVQSQRLIAARVDSDDRPTSFRSPWQNGHVERLIGSVRRECTDHLIVLNEEHLRRILAKFSAYYNGWRPHVSLGRMHRTGVRSSVSGTSSHMQSWADCITGTHESSSWKRQAYYNQARTHLALQKDAPLHRAVRRSGVIVAIPILAGLLHQYVRI